MVLLVLEFDIDFETLDEKFDVDFDTEVKVPKETDETLSISGKPADAKAVGDRLQKSKKKSSLREITL